MKKIFQALLFLLVSLPLYGQTGLGTAGQQEYARALTNGGRFGTPRYTTANRPTCSSSNVGGLIWNTTTTGQQVCDGSAWVGSAGGAGAFTTVTASTSVTVGTTTTAGTATCVVDGTMGGASATDNFVSCVGTTPTTLTAIAKAIRLSFSTAGSSSSQIWGIDLTLGAGYTGSSDTYAILVQNNVNGTGVAGTSNVAVEALAGGSTTGAKTGGLFGASGSSTYNLGATGTAAGTGFNIGLLGQANSAAVNIAGLFRNYAGDYAPGIVTYAASAALIADNFDGVSSSGDIFQGRHATAAPISTAAWTGMRVQSGGQVQIGNSVLTSGTAAVEKAAEVRTVTNSYTWTNAQVVTALAGTGDIVMATLPAKTKVLDAVVVITGAAATATTLTVGCGRASALYIDYVVASDAKAAANTVYGDAKNGTETGTNLFSTFFVTDLASYTGTTDVVCHFIKTGSDPTASTGRLILTTQLLP